MTNPDRIEFGSEPTSAPENPKKNGHIPRWLRTPVFTARTFLAILTATPGMVVAADAITRIANPSVVFAIGDNCENTELDFIGISFVDDPFAEYSHSNSYPYPARNSLDPGDIWMGSPQFGQVVIQYTEKPDDPKANWEEVGRFNMVNNGIYSLARIRLAGLNTNAKMVDRSPALFIKFYFDDNREMAQEIIYYNLKSKDRKINLWEDRNNQGQKIASVYIACGDTNLYPQGKLASDEEIQSAVSNPNFTFKRWEDIFAGFVRAEFHDFSYNNLPNNLLSVPQKDTRQAFQKYLDDKKRKVVLPTTSRPTSTLEPIRATPTAIPIATSTRVVEVTSGGSGPDLNWLWASGAAFFAGLASFWGYERWKRKNPSKQKNPPPQPPFPQLETSEWMTGKGDFEKRWQAAKGKLSPVRPGDRGDEYNYILERFTAGMGIVHEMSLDNNVIKIPKMTVRIRAGIEFVIPEIWPDNMILKRFFDPGFNAGFLTAGDLAKIVYLPEQYRTLSSFTKAQAEEVRRIHSILVHALHTNNPNISKNDTDPKLQDSIDILLKRFNTAWPYIDRLIR